GLGSQTLAGTFPFVLPYRARLALTYASVLLAALLCVSPSPGASRHPLPASGERDRVRGTAAALALGTAIVGTIALLGSGLYVDRYALDSAWSLVVFLALVIPWERAKAVAIT